MKNGLLLGLGRFMIPLPAMLWRRLLASNARKVPAGLDFMSPDHHRVRDYAVTQLPRAGVPLQPDSIAADLGVSSDRLAVILDELERRLTFLVRNELGEVSWAYPVTVDQTPHRATFSTGEEAFSP
jgi:hypothetical protein